VAVGPQGSRQLISGNPHLVVYSFSEEVTETKSAYFAACLTQSGPGNITEEEANQIESKIAKATEENRGREA